VTRRRGAARAALLAATLLLATGCTIGEDDEMVPPTRTVTASPSPDVTAAPASVPVGDGDVSPDDVVWAQGSALHVGRRSVDLSPAALEAFVVVPGGVFAVASGELWFTDLARLRGTGLTGVTGLQTTAGADRILVTLGGAGGTTYAFDTATGQSVSPDGVVPLTPEDRLWGPDRAGMRVPDGFRLAGWAGDRTFYGVATPRPGAGSVVSCSLDTRRCTTLGRLEGSPPVIFGTGL
jgi:hypothetical protein